MCDNIVNGDVNVSMVVEDTPKKEPLDLSVFSGCKHVGEYPQSGGKGFGLKVSLNSCKNHLGPPKCLYLKVIYMSTYSREKVISNVVYLLQN